MNQLYIYTCTRSGQPNQRLLLNPRSSPPRSNPPRSSPLIKSNIKNINPGSTLTLTKLIPIQVLVYQSIGKAMSYLTLPRYPQEF